MDLKLSVSVPTRCAQVAMLLDLIDRLHLSCTHAMQHRLHCSSSTDASLPPYIRLASQWHAAVARLRCHQDATLVLVLQSDCSHDITLHILSHVVLHVVMHILSWDDLSSHASQPQNCPVSHQTRRLRFCPARGPTARSHPLALASPAAGTPRPSSRCPAPSRCCGCAR
jgi:hypothetical protein